MKRLIKAAAIILSVAFCLSAQGCSKLKQKSLSSAAASSQSSKTDNKKAEEKLIDGKFSLPYTSVSSFNPLTPSSELNMVLWPLMYDCLSQPDMNYAPQLCLAEAIDNSGTAVKITLKSGIKFTDGSALSGTDVKYSLDSVKGNTASPYNSRLSNVNSISANGRTVTINLNSPDPLFANLLDIPIIKSGSGSTDNAIGTGRYIYSTDGVNANLTVNKNWYGGKTPIITKINLRNIPYKDAVMTSLSIENINCVYSDYGSGSLGTATNIDTYDVNLNQLVFVGMNTDKERLSNAHLRKALSYSLDRASIVSQIYSNHALAALSPFNPKWSKLEEPKAEELASDISKSENEIAAAGGAGKGTAYTLLVNSENATKHSAANFIASCFSKTGITVNVKAVPFADYTAAIQSGNFDMYIGELKLSNNMDISPFLITGGAASYATPRNSKTIAAFTSFRSGKADIKSVVSAFADEMPFIPVCYHMGTLSHTKTLSGITATDSNIFFDFDKWGYKQQS